MSGTSTGRPVDDKIVIDDDMDFDTAAESDFFSKITIILDRLRKMLNRSSEDAMQDIDKRSLIWWMFMSSTVETSVLMVQNYSENLHSNKITGKISF